MKKYLNLFNSDEKVFYNLNKYKNSKHLADKISNIILLGEGEELLYKIIHYLANDFDTEIVVETCFYLGNLLEKKHLQRLINIRLYGVEATGPKIRFLKQISSRLGIDLSEYFYNFMVGDAGNYFSLNRIYEQLFNGLSVYHKFNILVKIIDNLYFGRFYKRLFLNIMRDKFKEGDKIFNMLKKKLVEDNLFRERFFALFKKIEYWQFSSNSKQSFWYNLLFCEELKEESINFIKNQYIISYDRMKNTSHYGGVMTGIHKIFNIPSED